jgi:hypothetical protein
MVTGMVGDCAKQIGAGSLHIGGEDEGFAAQHRFDDDVARIGRPDEHGREPEQLGGVSALQPFSRQPSEVVDPRHSTL